MALLLRKKHFSLPRLLPIFTSQKCTQTLIKDFLDSEVESIHSVAPQSYVLDMSKWRKIDVSRFRWWIPPFPFYIINTLQKGGFEAYLVGGCVRDLLLNRVPKDFDIITTATLRQVKHKFHPAFIVGRRFPICIVRSNNLQVEVSSFNTVSKHAESEEKDQLLSSCMPGDCDGKDFMRWRNCMHRDFTINSLFYDPFKKCIYDYANGMKDLNSLKLRTLVPAHLSFQEDCARILRGIRIAGRLGLLISRDTATAMHELSSSLRQLDEKRILMELNYMLSYGAAGPTISLLQRFKLLEVFFPFHAAYIKQQSHERCTSMMLMKLFFFLDRLVTCDRPCDCILWIGLLAFHQALVINPQDCLTIKAFASALYHGNWSEGVKFASQNNQSQVDFAPEISGFSNFKSNEELAKEVSQLASFVQTSVNSLVDENSLVKSMSKYPSSTCYGLVFVSERKGRHVAQLFDVLVSNVELYEDEREKSEINYVLLGKGDLPETRFVLGKVILETLGVELVQRRKNAVNSILFSEPEKEIARKQELVKINYLSEEEIVMRKEELTSKDNCKEMVKVNLQLMGSSHSPDEISNLPHNSMVKIRKRKMSDILLDTVEDNSAKLKGTSIMENLAAKKDKKRILSPITKQEMSNKQKFIKSNRSSLQEMATKIDELASKDRCKEVLQKNLNMDSSRLPDANLLHKTPKKDHEREVSDELQHTVEDKTGKHKETSTQGKLSSFFR